MYNNILELKNITKVYPGVRALDDVNITLKQGEVHALVGENGAGKSTIIKVITGAIQPTSGEIIFQGKSYKHMTPVLSKNIGIAAIYQELTLFEYLSISENIFFGREPKTNGFVNFRKMHNETKDVLKKVGTKLNTKQLVKGLGVAYQQIIEIAKAISQEIKLIIMDEPSAPLTINEIDTLFNIVETLKKEGITVIYISHRLEEIFKICDRVTVLRDGQYIQTKDVTDTNERELISLMVGREIKARHRKSFENKQGEVILELTGFTNEKLIDVNIQLRQGEILGIGGLVGAGRTELARAIFGADGIRNGTLKINNKVTTIKNPKNAIEQGIMLIPEDRKAQGLLLQQSVLHNISFANMKFISKLGFIKKKQEKTIAKKLKDSLKIKTPSLDQIVRNLSGGNQQKVVLAKALATKCDILIFDEPTRGIDVGAKSEIYVIMQKLAEQGKGIIMISSEMQELLSMSDRILVMREGRITGQLTKEEFSQTAIMELASIDIKDGEKGII